jgi:hypothetical protein
MALRALCILLLVWTGVAQAATAALATATIVDGSPTLLRASSKFRIVEGSRLAAVDIVETGSARHLRIEFADGLVLDLGPATSVQLAPQLAGGEAARRGARVYLRQGTAKVTVPVPAPPATGPLLAAERLDLRASRRGVVVLVDGAEASAFAESGEATLAERRAGKALAPVRLKESEFLAGGAVATSPAPGFIARLPRPFLDTLPARAALFRDSEPASTPAGALVYADVQPWIDAEPALRAGFVTRWRALARQPEFRKGLEQGLAAHPEWDRVLYPEKYLPPASAPTAAPAPGAKRYGTP